MEKVQIRCWLDVEHRLAKRWLAPFRMWRVVREIDRESGKTGKLALSMLVERLATILEVTQANVMRTLAAGQDVFWTLSGDKSDLYLIGYRRVYAHFGCEPSRSAPKLVDASRIAGNVSRFKHFIVAVKLAHYQGTRSSIEEPRETIAKAMGISLPTLRTAAKAGWIEIQQHVRVIGDVPQAKPRTHPGGVRIKPMIVLHRGEGERTMEIDGESKIVKQFVNVYRSVFAFSGKPLGSAPWVERNVAFAEPTVPEGWHW